MRIFSNRNYFLSAMAAILLVLVAFAVPGCGGGGGGGGAAPGGGADTTAPTIRFTTPNPTGTLSFEADPQRLPAQLAVSYTDASGAVSSSFASAFTFRGITFDLQNLYFADATSATTASDASPLYWTVISKYRTSDNSLVSLIPFFGVTKSSTGNNNAIDVDTARGIIVVAAASRSRLLYVNTATSVTEREISGLPGAPSALRVCPDQGKVYVAFSGVSAVYSYSTTSGAQQAAINLPAVPRAIAINKAASVAYIIFDNSRTLVSINCNNNAITSTTLGFTPWSIETNGLGADTLYYAGYNGSDKALFRYSGGIETRLVTLPEMPEDMAYDGTSSRLLLASYTRNAVDVRSAVDGVLAATVATGVKPIVVRPSYGGRTLVLNSSGDSVTVINVSTATAGATVSLNADPVGIVSDGSSSGYYYVLQNLWEISSSTTGVLGATVRDAAGNTGASSLTLTFTPVSSGGPGAP